MGADGKLRGLAWLLREHGEALEADFQRHYHLDLTGLWRGEITPRRAAVLAAQLPLGSQTWISVGSDAAWTVEAHMAASQIDLLQVGNWQRSGGKGRPPKPIDRPTDMRKAREKQDRALERAARFARKHGTPTPSPAEDAPKPPTPRDSRGRFLPRR